MSREYHGLRSTLEYHIWNSMKDRCFNSKSKSYPRYGGRGITVCERWRDSFTTFYADMGAKPGPGYSIERKDNDGDYEPNNCYWATPKEQNANKSTNVKVEHNGRLMIRKEYAKELGISAVTLSTRMNRGGMSLEDAANMVPYHARLYEHSGESLTLRQWAEKLGVNYFRLYNVVVRMKRTIGQAIEIIERQGR